MSAAPPEPLSPRDKQILAAVLELINNKSVNVKTNFERLHGEKRTGTVSREEFMVALTKQLERGWEILSGGSGVLTYDRLKKAIKEEFPGEAKSEN